MKKNRVFKTAFDEYHQLGTPLGEGGSGRVFQVKDGDGVLRAIKVLRPEKFTSDGRRRFKNELSFCQRQRHPNIVTVLDQGVVTEGGIDCPFYVMPYYKSTLRQFIENQIDPFAVLPLFNQILDGIEAAHLQDVWHRDLKPENILYDPDKNVVVVSDFGIAHFAESHLLTFIETGKKDRLANFNYSAPEQRVPKSQVDTRADIYALGLLLNEMFTKVTPVGTGIKLIASVAQDLSYLDDLVAHMMRQSPAERPQSIAEVKEFLIAQRNSFVRKQKLDGLRQTVIPIVDLAASDFIDVNLVDVDIDGSVLILKLNVAPLAGWQETFASISVTSYTYGFGPRDAQFGIANAVYRDVQEHLVPQVVLEFKKFLETANRDFRHKLEHDNLEAEREERSRLEERVKAEERRLRILSKIRL